jgi:hypothetical protein
MHYNVRHGCRVCPSGVLEPVLDLGDQYLVNFVQKADYALPKAPLELMRCSACGLLQLGATVEPDLLYRKFWYRSAVNDTMRGALRDVVLHGGRYHQYGNWLDIGANDGYLLSEVPRTMTKVAVEPARDFTEELAAKSDHAIMDYFSRAAVEAVAGEKKYQVITSCAMFYDLDNPHPFVQDVADMLAPDGVWINQLNDAPTMIKQNAWDAVCHEHVCYYDFPTLDRLYREHGLYVREVTYNETNGGSMRVVAGKEEKTPFEFIEGVARPTLKGFADRARRWKTLMVEMLSGPFGKEPWWCYGASTKGTVLLQYLNEGTNIVHDKFLAVADRNPRKVGLRMVGTWLPITDEAALRAQRPKFALVLPWAFFDEIVSRETSLRDAGTCLVMPLPHPTFIL